MSRLDDGYRTLLSFAANASVKLYQKTVTPPGISAGGAIDTTTMHNNTWRTQEPKALKTLTDASITAAYDTACYTEILAMVGVKQLITITFPDSHTYAFWGWIDEFTPKEMKEGEQPEADVKIIPSNTNDAGAETAPVYT